MTELIIGKDKHFGQREIYNSRVDVRKITTAGGLYLTVAVVADGRGTAQNGARAAQIGLDTVFGYLQGSRLKINVHQLLIEAVEAANEAVFAARDQTDGAISSLAVAAATEKNLLYIANVGDSRVYLARREKLTLLTRDHNHVNMRVWQGRMYQQAEGSNVLAGTLVRALGLRDEVLVDIGFYVGAEDYNIAQQRGVDGLQLQEGDSVLICSQGLIKTSSVTSRRYVTDHEIVYELRSQEADNAARMLVSQAVARNADDNISLALIQMPDPERRALITKRSRRQMLPVFAAAISAVVLIALAFIFIYWQASGRQSVAMAQTRQAIEAIRQIDAQEIATRDAELAIIQATLQMELWQLATQEAKLTIQAGIHATQIAREGEESICFRAAGYHYIADAEPFLDPAPGTKRVSGQPVTVRAVWQIVNTGCPLMPTLRPVRSDGPDLVPVLLNEAGNRVIALGKGERGSLVLEWSDPPFDDDGVLTLDERWYLLVQDREGEVISLFDTDNSGLHLQQTRWVTLDDPIANRSGTDIAIATNPETPATSVVIDPTSTPVPRPTSTPVPFRTNTPLPRPTSTPAPRPTSTPVRRLTNTPVPRPTNTPVPLPTNTLAPLPTNTPVPLPTNTPTPDYPPITLKSGTSCNNPLRYNALSDIKFEWRWGGVLRDGLSFHIVVMGGGGRSGIGNEAKVGNDWEYMFNPRLGPGTYQWQVLLMQGGQQVGSSSQGCIAINEGGGGDDGRDDGGGDDGRGDDGRGGG